MAYRLTSEDNFFKKPSITPLESLSENIVLNDRTPSVQPFATNIVSIKSNFFESKADSKKEKSMNTVKQIVDKEITAFPSDLNAVSSSRLQELLNLYKTQSAGSLLLKVHPLYKNELAVEVANRINLLIEELNVRGIQQPEDFKSTKAPKFPIEIKAERIIDRQLLRFPEDIATTSPSRLGELYAHYLEPIR